MFGADYTKALIEINKGSRSKYEIDKETGFLTLDRELLMPYPANYGFIPQTYCGDHDPLDVLVLGQEAVIPLSIMTAKPIGVMKMVDQGEADDKIIAVLESDPFWDEIKDLSDLSNVLKSRLEHYFMTYKMIPGGKTPVKLGSFYDLKHAEKVIRAAMADYIDEFSTT